MKKLFLTFFAAVTFILSNNAMAAETADMYMVDDQQVEQLIAQSEDMSMMVAQADLMQTTEAATSLAQPAKVKASDQKFVPALLLNLFLGVRGAYHISELLNLKDDKFDLYGAGGVGLAIENGYATDYDIITGRYVYGTRIRPQLLLRVGSRYNFSPNMAGWAELGSGGSWIQAGISFKL